MSDEFETLDDRLQRAGAATDAAECHGFVTGVLCAAGGLDPAAWLPHLFGEVDWDSAAVKEAALAVGGLFQELRARLNSADLDFRLLLPADELPLRERAESLGRWCQGFSSGLGLGGLDRERALSGDSGEFLRDVSDISRVAAEFEGGDEEDERAYMELQEYLRMGVLMLHEELQPLPAAPRLQ